MDHISQTRPRLRQDVVFLETHEGAYVRSADLAFLMKGASAYRWLSSLAPYMTGEHSVAELVDGLEQPQAETVQRLVATLLERGFVRDAREDGTAALPADVATRFARQVSFVDHFANESHKRFAAFRGTRVLLSGDGVLATAAATGLLVNGLAELAVMLGAAELARIEDVARETALAGIEASVTHLGEPDGEVPAGYEVVVHCSETGDLAALLAASRTAAGAGATFLPVYAFDGRVFVGPMVERGSTAGLESALLRLSDNGVGRHLWRGVAMGQAAGDVRASLPALVARMAGSLAALEVFKHRTGALLPESAGAVVVQDAETLESRREVLLPHPAVLDVRDPLPGRLDGSAGEEPSDEQTYERVSALVNPHVGTFRLFTDDGLRQIPVKVGRLDTPALEPEATAGGRVVGFSSEHVMSARLAALLRATGAYALQTAAAAGPRLLEASTAGERASQADPAALTTWTGGIAPFEPAGWLGGRSLVSQAVVGLPVEAVLARPATRARGWYEPSHAGVGVGPTLHGAVGAGLASALAHDRLRRLVRGEAALVPLELAHLVEGEDDVRLCARSLAALSESAWLAEVVAGGGIHVAVGRAAGGGATAVASGWGRRAGDAVAQCLLGLGGRLQCLADGVDLPAAGMDLLDVSLDADVRTAAPEASRWAEEPCSAEDLLGAATGLGLDPVVVDLTPPDLAMHAALSVVRVLLVRHTPAHPAS